MSTLEKIAKIKKMDVLRPLIEEESLIVFTSSCGKIVVGIREEDEESYNWNTQIFSL